MKIDITLPKSWQDLSLEQVLIVAKQFSIEQDKQSFLTQCFLRFSGWKLRRKMIRTKQELLFVFSHEKQQFTLDAATFRELCQSLNFLLEHVELCKLVPQIGNFLTCNEKLYDLTLERYLLADNFYIAYSTTQAASRLDLLCAVLCTPKGKTWNEQKLQVHAQELEGKFPIEKQALYLWYTGMKSWLKTKYPHVFGSSNSTSTPTPADEIILNILSVLNQGDVTKNPMIYQAPVHEALQELNRRIEQSTSNP